MGPLAAWDGLGDRPDQSPSFQRHRIQKARDAKAYASDTDGFVPSANALALASEELITDEVENRRMAKAVIICHACELGVVTRADMKTAYLSKRRARIVRKLLDTWRPPPQARPYANAR